MNRSPGCPVGLGVTPDITQPLGDNLENLGCQSIIDPQAFAFDFHRNTRGADSGFRLWPSLPAGLSMNRLGLFNKRCYPLKRRASALAISRAHRLRAPISKPPVLKNSCPLHRVSFMKKAILSVVFQIKMEKLYGNRLGVLAGIDFIREIFSAPITKSEAAAILCRL